MSSWCTWTHLDGRLQTSSAIGILGEKQVKNLQREALWEFMDISQNWQPKISWESQTVSGRLIYLFANLPFGASYFV